MCTAISAPVMREGSAEALPSRPERTPASLGHAASASCSPMVQVLEARLAAVGGEVDGALRSVVDHERVAVQLDEPG